MTLKNKPLKLKKGGFMHPIVRTTVHVRVAYATPHAEMLERANRQLYENTGLPLEVSHLFADPHLALNECEWEGDVYYLEFPDVDPLGTFDIRDSLGAAGYYWADTYQALVADALISGEFKLNRFVLPRCGIWFLGAEGEYTPILYSANGSAFVGIENRHKGNFAGYLIPAIKIK